MAAIIDSAPSCVKDVGGANPPDDIADFIVQAPYEDCAGFMTFGPGSTYGEEGVGAAGAYIVVTVIGIVVMVAVLIAWVYVENRRLHAHRLILRGGTGAVEAD
jgi:hypothetical protein